MAAGPEADTGAARVPLRVAVRTRGEEAKGAPAGPGPGRAEEASPPALAPTPMPMPAPITVVGLPGPECAEPLRPPTPPSGVSRSDDSGEADEPVSCMDGSAEEPVPAPVPIA